MPHTRLPAEWEPQSGVMLSWPYAGKHHYWGDAFTEVEKVFVHIATEISLREKVLIVCNNHEHHQHVHALLSASPANMDNVILVLAPTDDVWARDHGPITIIKDQQHILLDFTFNGWGNKFPAAQDNRISANLANQKLFPSSEFKTIDFVLEGGAIESDGKGTLLTTSHCLLSATRNPDLDRGAIEQNLKDYFGLAQILWLESGFLAGDDTDGHIDTLARFCDTGTIAYVQCKDPGDEHYHGLKQMERELHAMRTLENTPYRLIGLPMPDKKIDADGQRLPATYANFLIINNAVLVPTYRDTHDATALKRIASCFPDREVIAIDCLPLIHQYGSLHCVTMQLPAGVLV